MKIREYQGRRGGRAVSAVVVTMLTAQVVSGCSSMTAKADQPESATNCPATAAASHGWGAPDRSVDFADSSSLDGWNIYNGPGHAGNGRRTPAAISVSGGLMTITGDADGNSGGLALEGGHLYGRWEVCVRSLPGAATYHPVLLLWPDAEDWPVGGEIDFMEITDPNRRYVEAWLHYGPDDRREGDTVAVDATQWHSWAVEWTPDRIVAYVDGAPWWSTTNTAHFPPRSMHLCVQLDNFGGDTKAGGEMLVDWVRQYPARLINPHLALAL
jgi:hypothetical protein